MSRLDKLFDNKDVKDSFNKIFSDTTTTKKQYVQSQFVYLASTLKDYYLSIEKMFSSFNSYYHYYNTKFPLRNYLVRSMGLLAKIFKTFFLLGVKLLIFPNLYEKYVNILVNIVNQMTDLASEVKNISFYDEQKIYDYLLKQWKYKKFPFEDKKFLKNILIKEHCNPIINLIRDLKTYTLSLNSKNIEFEDPLNMLDGNSEISE